jgi:hypothetical protein
MKNIHVLPTDKPSEFYSINGKHKLANSTMAMDWYISSAGYKPHNIYITSDVEISGLENNIWVYNNGRVWLWQNTMALVSNNKPRKIILTTDQDLIKDGVQAIDDEFLEWFVKNPSCEFVNVVEDKKLSKKHISSAREGDLVYNRHGTGGIINQLSNDVRVGIGNYIEIGATSDNGWETLNICGYKIYEKCYKIIIPQEYQSECICDVECRGFLNVKCKKQEKTKEEPKHSTIEEAAKKYKDLKLPDDLYDAFIAGAKWQQERMYNVDDMKRAYNACYSPFGFDKFGELEQDFQKWFETFKKK